ncbi:hypothetical protein PHAVU_006G143000 [Phaseolus vulgaris]|uniref:Uncharacterized protein n=1 Tax=Phaseolus vulgaris TaxID=3885 RepID=V7BRL7_PHAVU|nr:hypothetical protein PHAVU_006G143000g [Phaseolus vulgaris]ESW19648.1 hypothetical protein PHAVU_006G143000g [Phaseolus vulgaris]
MASFSITGPIKYKTFTSFSQLSFSTTDNVSIPRKLNRKVGAHANFHPSFLNQSSWLSWHGSLYSEKQRGLSLIAFDAESSESEGEDNQTLETVMKFYSAFKNKRTHELSADERQRVTNFLSFFEAFQGRTQVLEFFSYLTTVFGNNIQIILKPTAHDGINVGLQWRFEWDKIQLPLWKGFNLHISHTYHGKAVIRNIEMFMKPLSHFKPFGLKTKVGIGEFMEKIGSFMVSGSRNKAKRILSLLLAVMSLAAFLFFMKLAS